MMDNVAAESTTTTTTLAMTQEDITAAVIAAADVNFESRGELVQDRSITISQKRYLDWVDYRLVNGIFDYDDWEENGKRYFRRAYVDLYFQEEIATWIVKPEMARRTVFALQKLADHQENSVSTDAFVVDDSRLVQSSLEASRMMYDAGQRRR
jgi:hypothetical protein